MDSDDFYVQYSGRSCNLSVQLCFDHSMKLHVYVRLYVRMFVCLSVWVFVVVGFVVVGFVVLLFVVVASKRNQM